jgi:hypothetical protein
MSTKPSSIIGIILGVLPLFISFSQAGAQVTFQFPSLVTVGASPQSIAAVDVNGDGKIDLVSASANTQGNTLTVMTNNGAGVFGFNATLTVGSRPTSVIASDVNNDGKPDLICANSGNLPFQPGNTLSIFTNDGSGGFGSNATLTVGSAPQSIIAADVNGDSFTDLISANNGTNTLSVLTNDGSGVFGFNATLTVGNYPFSVVATDVNGDGKLDLIATVGTGFTVLTNNGSGVFGSNATYTVVNGISYITSADVNGDGKVDVTFSAGTALIVFTNNGIGGFGSNATYTVSSGNPRQVTAADMNGDGKVDLICADFPFPSGGVSLSVFTNNGGGGFALASSPRVFGAGPWGVTAADVNGDGKLDLISANYHDTTLSVLINTSTFPQPTSTPTLTINPSGNRMLIAWPSASAGWSLQQNSDLTTANWSPSGYSGYPIVDDGTSKNLIVAPPTGNLFFRLFHP